MEHTINYNTELRHFAYPSINQFRNVIQNVKHTSRYLGPDADGNPTYDHLKPLPTLTVEGTTKLHGTNAAIVFDFVNDIIYYQSRENVIIPMQDNAGFASYMASIQSKLFEAYENIMLEGETYFEATHMIIFGEWCGGNIQKGMAITGLEKMFVVFDIRAYNERTDEYRWLTKDSVKSFKSPENRIYNIYGFRTWQMDINFDKPELAQNELTALTLQIEDNCPIGAAFGKEGLGEGIVWKVIGDPKYTNNSGFWMKVKGEKHSVSKVKTLAAVDIEKINNINEFVDTYVTDNRCEQSIQKLREANLPVTRASLGEFIRWIHNDIIKEENDTIQANGLEPKELGSPIANKARTWFFTNEINF